MTATTAPSPRTETAEDVLNAALWHATLAAHAAFATAEARRLSLAGTAALALAEAEQASHPMLARVIRSDVLRDCYARAVAAEAVRMVRENGPPPALDGDAS